MSNASNEGTPISVIFSDISVRAQNCINSDPDYVTLEAIEAATDSTLKRTPNFGERTIMEVRDAIKKYRLDHPKAGPVGIPLSQEKIDAEIANQTLIIAKATNELEKLNWLKEKVPLMSSAILTQFASTGVELTIEDPDVSDALERLVKTAMAKKFQK